MRGWSYAGKGPETGRSCWERTLDGVYMTIDGGGDGRPWRVFARHKATGAVARRNAATMSSAKSIAVVLARQFKRPHKLTAPQRRALEVMADCSEWVPTGNQTVAPPSAHTVNGATALRLERLGFAKTRWDALCDDQWQRVCTITRKGMRAIGWVGAALR